MKNWEHFKVNFYTNSTVYSEYHDSFAYISHPQDVSPALKETSRMRTIAVTLRAVLLLRGAQFAMPPKPLSISMTSFQVDSDERKQVN